ncbi:MAG: hypothetical protein ACE5GW_08800 [Planctomycetota bacterium]
MSSAYRHTQVATWLLAGFAVVALTIVLVSAFQGWHLASMILLGMTLAVALIFPARTVEIAEGQLRCRYGAGLVRRRFALEEITGASAVRNRWIYGWGVRWTPHGWMFNISGLDAVEIRLRSGRRFRIGTDMPEELEAAIRRAAGLTGAGDQQG